MKHSKNEGPGTGRLEYYRAYFLDGVDQMISSVYEFEAENDETAIKIADAWREGRPVELWNRARKVKTLND